MKKFINLLIVLIISQLHYAQEWDQIGPGQLQDDWVSHIDNFAVISPGNVWVGNNSLNDPLVGLFIDDFGTSYQWIDSVDNPEVPGNATYDLTIDNSGNLWFYSSGNNDDGVVRFDGSTLNLFNTDNTTFLQNFVADISVDKYNNIWFTENDNITKYDGSTWQTTEYDSFLSKNYAFEEIEFDNQDNMWLGTFDGIVEIKSDGSVVEYDTSNTNLKVHAVSDLEFDGNGNIWLALYFGGVVRANMDFSNVTIWDTTNSQIAVGGDFGTARSVEIDNNGIVWVGHETGVASYDGSNWTYYNSSNSPLPEYDGTTQLVYDIQVDANNNKYFLTLFDGIYVFNKDVINAVEEEGSIPTQFKLSQNYPNPFNPSTTIKFSIPQQTSVSLKVYDVLGKEVAELVNEEMSTGSYSVDFDASNLSSGIYFYTLKTNNFFSTRKMLLIK